jgi:hypothetical protein
MRDCLSIRVCLLRETTKLPTSNFQRKLEFSVRDIHITEKFSKSTGRHDVAVCLSTLLCYRTNPRCSCQQSGPTSHNNGTSPALALNNNLRLYVLVRFPTSLRCAKLSIRCSVARCA